MLIPVISYGQKKKVAVLPAVGASMSQDILMGVTTALQEGITNSGKYIVLVRDKAYKQVLKEYQFQQTGAVSDDQLTAFGHALGADFVCYATISKYSETSFLIGYKMIDVSSGAIVNPDHVVVRNGIDGLLTATDEIAKKLSDSGFTPFSYNTPKPINNHFANYTETINKLNIEMVAVQGGTFTMGYTGEQGSVSYVMDKPAHQVTVSSFYIGKYEVTQKQWELIMGSNPSYFKGDDLPVEQVSWDDTQDFIRRLNTVTGKQYRLPTEAEWEFAARGGNKSQGYSYSGSNNPNDVSWYSDNSGYTTHPIGTKRPNELGICDMSGNVEEWCQDWLGNYPSSPQRDPIGPEFGDARVFRGGPFDLRTVVWDRNGLEADHPPINILGFRLACSSN